MSVRDLPRLTQAREKTVVIKTGRDSGADKVFHKNCVPRILETVKRGRETGNGKRETHRHKSFTICIVPHTVIITLLYALIQHDQYVQFFAATLTMIALQIVC